MSLRRERHALILAPAGRDAAVASALLNEIGILSTIVGSVEDLIGIIGDEVLFIVVTEESLRTSDLHGLSDWVQHQPIWSDLAFIILTRQGGGPERNPAAARLLVLLGNVTFVERPFHPTTFMSVARTALRGRDRQFESRNTLDELRESGERLGTALIAGRLGSWELDVETSHLTASDACKAIFGRRAEDHLAYPDLLGTIHADDRDRLRQGVRKTAESGGDCQVEFRTIWPNQTCHWAEMRASLVTSRGRTRIVGVALDITERKAGEEQLRDQNHTLEAHVATRTQELKEAHRAILDEIAQREAAESKLRQAQKMEMIGQLTGGIAHDFNNLLMAVISNLDLLRKYSSEDPRSLRLIEGALKGAHRGASLTQRLLAFARRQDLSLVVADLNELVRGIRHMLEQSISSTIELFFELPDFPARAELDVNQVELALLNLVVNARDAMPQGGKLTIAVDCGRWPPDRQAGRPYVRLMVRDSGHGMDKSTLERAKEPFFSTKGVGKGTGLGLSMIHGLVEQLGGEFRLSSSPGAGTVAELLFPMTDKTMPMDAPSPSPPPLTPGTKKLRILIVDDDALIAMSSVDMLEDLGHEVVEANSGEAALLCVREGQAIDLMITDYAMPKMNGAQLAMAVRDIYPKLPIILATGYADLPQGVELGLPRLNKPYTQEQMALQISKVTSST